MSLQRNCSIEDCQNWLNEYQRKKGRPIRILHIGNIANNAYLNAKLQREFGIEADVISHDYNHIMGSPEWEDAQFKGEWGDDLNPDFKRACEPSFQRPTWFYSGTREEAINKIFNHFNNIKKKSSLKDENISPINEIYLIIKSEILIPTKKIIINFSKYKLNQFFFFV